MKIYRETSRFWKWKSILELSKVKSNLSSKSTLLFQILIQAFCLNNIKSGVSIHTFVLRQNIKYSFLRRSSKSIYS